jgi:hypothetical protein
LIGRAGTPTAVQSLGIGPVTTAPAPMTDQLPTFADGISAAP